MGGGRNRSWIAGALTAACVLALVCFVALPGKGPQPGISSTENQQVDIELPHGAPPSALSAAPDAEQDYFDVQPEKDPYGGLEYEPGIVLVTLPTGISPADALTIIQEETGIGDLALADETDARAPATTAAEDPQLVEFAVPANVALPDAIDLISASSAVDAAQPNFIYELADDRDSETRARDALITQNYIVQDLVTAATANDARIGEQWMLPSVYAYNDTTGVGNAWDKVTANHAVTIAVIDEGFQADHVDLAANVVDAYNSVTKASGVSAVSEVEDENGHGTHAAGIVAAAANNNQVGVAGVSYNANLMLIKAYDETQYYDESAGKWKARAFTSASIVAAFQHAINARSTKNVRVISMSVCGKAKSTTGWKDDSIIKQIDAATNAGIVVVCAAGNDTTAPVPFLSYPSDYHNVVGVINLEHHNSDPHNVSRASSSNFNSSKPSDGLLSGKDISAPGTSILSTMPGNEYNTKSGTSMACPVVSGVLALVFTQQPNLTAADATNLLYNTTTDLGEEGWDEETGYGEVNAYRAITETDAYVSGNALLMKGQTIALTAGSGGWQWSTSNGNVATVSSNGVVTGVGGGTARISAQCRIGFAIMRRYKDVVVYDPVLSGAGSVAAGSTAQITLSCKVSGSWNWSSSNSSVATVNSNGVVTGKSVGSATITAKLSNSSSIYATKTITVTKGDFSKASITLSPTSYTYNGTARQPSVTSVKVGSNTLKEGTDYKVSGYSNNVNVGTATVTLYGIGSYTGTANKTFTISKASIASATLSQTSYTYDGKVKNPTVTVKGSDGRTLKEGTDYTLITPAGRTAVGTYTYSITGKGNYEGSKTASFTVSATRVAMYRMYNPYGGEHHYTTAAAERDALVKAGWKYEGVAWYAPSVSSTPVYRMYNPYGGEHHYTMSASERDALKRVGWRYEGVGWYSDDAKGTLLYRLYNPYGGQHHYTTSSSERDTLRRVGWKYEGTAWYGMK